jgi:cytidine deaminase
MSISTTPASSADPTDTELVDAAMAARAHAYVPYSEFAMGAAVRTEAGTVVPGTVVENVSLGLAMCAERVALFACVAAGERPASLALVSPRTDGKLTYPCGACLQVALELGGPGVEVVTSDLHGATERTTVGALLPRGPRKDGR